VRRPDTFCDVSCSRARSAIIRLELRTYVRFGYAPFREERATYPQSLHRWLVATRSSLALIFRGLTLNNVEQVFIPCELAGSGMFPTEVSVRIHTAEGTTVSFFTDRSLLVQKDEKQSVKATRLSTEGPISLCLLPSEDTDSGSRWVRVKSEDLLVA